MRIELGLFPKKAPRARTAAHENLTLPLLPPE